MNVICLFVDIHMPLPNPLRARPSLSFSPTPKLIYFKKKPPSPVCAAHILTDMGVTHRVVVHSPVTIPLRKTNFLSLHQQPPTVLSASARSENIYTQPPTTNAGSYTVSHSCYELLCDSSVTFRRLYLILDFLDL